MNKMERQKAREIREKFLLEHPEIAAEVLSKTPPFLDESEFIRSGVLLLPQVDTLSLTKYKNYREDYPQYVLWTSKPSRGEILLAKAGRIEIEDKGLFQSIPLEYYRGKDNIMVLGILGLDNLQQVIRPYGTDMELPNGESILWRLK
jgi:hypothetical protein